MAPRRRGSWRSQVPVSWRARSASAAQPSAPLPALWQSGSPACRNNSQPAFSAPIRFHVAEALAAAGGKAEIELLHVLVLGERGAFAVHHHAAVFEDVAVVGVLERDVGVLLGQKKAHVLLA